MATAPANDIVEPAVAGEILLIPVAEIRRGERLRPIDPVWAEALGRIMVREGQQTPIEICRELGKPGWLLVAGGHRHAGAEHAGMDLIEARVVSGTVAHRRMREVTENLWRRDLDPIDRAAFIAELVLLKRSQAGIKDAAHREQSVPRAVKAEAARTLETISNVYGWSREIGAELGFTDRTIRNDLALYRGLAPSVIDLFRDARHPILRNAAQLRQLAKLDRDEQGRVAARMVDQGYGNAAKSVADAIQLVRGTNRPVGDPRAKRFATIIGTLSRMDARERLGLLQSPDFQGLLPAEAQQLLAPMRRDVGALA
jgi:hypothetical protein